MRGYIKNIRMVGSDDAVDAEVFNTTVAQLKHNVDLLYSTQNNTRQDKNLCELLYGNVMDYDEIGYKRFINGGNLDTLEKVLSFHSDVGALSLENISVFGGDNFLNYAIDAGITENIILRRNMIIPEALTGQKVLVAFKLMGFSSGSATEGERFDIYVNDEFVGSNDTKLISYNGNTVFRTIYGVYDLGAEERSLDVYIQRSISNSATPASYVIRVQSVFVGAHTLGNTSYELNYPTDIGFLNGEAPDINEFYDFESVNVKPIPTFLSSSKTVSGSNTYTINNTVNPKPQQTVYYIAESATGSGTGVDSSNRMDYATFLAINHETPNVSVWMASHASYANINFDDGAFYNIVIEGDVTVGGTGITVSNGSQVNIATDANLETSDLNVFDANFNFINNGSTTNKFTTDGLSVDNSKVEINAPIFSMPVGTGGHVDIKNRSRVGITIPNTGYTNVDAAYGFGFSFGPTVVEDYSQLDVNCSNAALLGHFGFGGGTEKPLEVKKHSDVTIISDGEVSRSATDNEVPVLDHSSLTIKTMQLDMGATAFQDITLKKFSSFSAVGISGANITSESSYFVEYM